MAGKALESILEESENDLMQVEDPSEVAIPLEQEEHLLREDTEEELSEKMKQLTTSCGTPQTSPDTPAPPVKNLSKNTLNTKITYRYCRDKRMYPFSRAHQARYNLNSVSKNTISKIPHELKCKPVPLMSLDLGIVPQQMSTIPKSRLYQSLESNGQWVVVCFNCREKGHLHYSCPHKM